MNPTRLPTLAAYLKSIKRPPGPPKSFFPNITFILTRTERRYPNQAVFRCPTFLTKYDITNYLSSIYGIQPIKVDTINYPTRFKMDPIRLVKVAVPAFKKAIVTLSHRFDYPPTVVPDQLDAATRERIMQPRMPKPAFHSKKARRYIDADDRGEDELFEPEKPKPARIDDNEPELVQYK